LGSGGEIVNGTCLICSKRSTARIFVTSEGAISTCNECVHTCKGCGKEFTYNRDLNDTDWGDDDFMSLSLGCCSDACTELSREKERKIRLHRFTRHIPPSYLKFDLSKIKCRSGYDLVMAFRPDPECKFWMYVHGPTGGGKTRSIFEWLKQEVTYEDVTIKFIQGGKLKKGIVARTRPYEEDEEKPEENLDEYLEAFYEADVLWIDEVDKIKFSERFEDEFFELLEYRAGQQLTTIFSCKSSPEQLLKKLGAEDGDQIYRRIKDFAYEVEFKKLPKSKAGAVVMDAVPQSEVSITKQEKENGIQSKVS
jgi:DNA replication protein DnaC